MAKIKSGDVMDLVTMSKASAPIGEIKKSMLTLEQFLEENLGDWRLCDGSSCVGTVYESLTGNAIVPDATTEGAFFRQAKAGRGLGSYEGDAIRNITGSWTNGDVSMFRAGSRSLAGAIYASGANSGYGRGYDGGSPAPRTLAFDASRQVPTSDENRPKNLAVNYFIKVGY